MLHNIPGTPIDSDLPDLEGAAQKSMKGNPIHLTRPQATVVTEQFRETAAYRGWQLLAAAVMTDHAHLVVGVLGDPDPERMLHSFKSYASRALNKRWQRPRNETWWTSSGSKRKLPDERAVLGAVRYVFDQKYPLAVWAPGKPGP